MDNYVVENAISFEIPSEVLHIIVHTQFVACVIRSSPNNIAIWEIDKIEEKSVILYLNIMHRTQLLYYLVMSMTFKQYALILSQLLIHSCVQFLMIGILIFKYVLVLCCGVLKKLSIIQELLVDMLMVI